MDDNKMEVDLPELDQIQESMKNLNLGHTAFQNFFHHMFLIEPNIIINSENKVLSRYSFKIRVQFNSKYEAAFKNAVTYYNNSNSGYVAKFNKLSQSINFYDCIYDVTLCSSWC